MSISMLIICDVSGELINHSQEIYIKQTNMSFTSTQLLI